MALNIEAMIADAFMEICEIRPVEKIIGKGYTRKKQSQQKSVL